MYEQDDLEAILERLEKSLSRLERSARALRGDGDEEYLGDEQRVSGEGFAAFLKEHPELTEPEPLSPFTDENTFSALREALRRHDAHWKTKYNRHYGAVDTSEVVDVLRERAGLGDANYKTRAFRSDCGRVVGSLRRLERAGRVTCFRSRHRNGSIHWVPAEKERGVSRDIREYADETKVLSVTDEKVLSTLRHLARRRPEGVPASDVLRALAPKGVDEPRRARGELSQALVRLRESGAVTWVKDARYGAVKFWRPVAS